MIQTATLNINRTLSNFCRTVESESYERSRRVIICRKLPRSTKYCFKQRHIGLCTDLKESFQIPK